MGRNGFWSGAFQFDLLKWGAYYWRSFGLESSWGSIDTMTIGKTHSTLGHPLKTANYKTWKRHIESGGYGDLYLGHNNDTGEDVTVKIGHERSIEVIFFILLPVLSIIIF